MPRFTMCFDISGLMECTVEADTIEEAEEKGMEEIGNSDWNRMSCVDIAMTDYEEEESDGE